MFSNFLIDTHCVRIKKHFGEQGKPMVAFEPHPFLF